MSTTHGPRGFGRRQLFGRSAGLGMLLAAGSMAATSCGNSGSSGSDVDFFARGDDAIWHVFRELRTAFHKQHPDISVNIEDVPGDWDQKFQLKLASGTAPNCLFEAAGNINPHIRAGALEPLDDLIKKHKGIDKQDFWPIAWLASQDHGKTYGLPYDGGSVVLYYNLDLLDAAKLDPPDPKKPMPWEQAVEYGKKLTIDHDGHHPGEPGFDPKRIKQYGFDPQAASLPYAWVWGNGGEVITKDKQVPLDEPEAVAALQFLADMGTKSYIAPSPAYAQSGSLSFDTGNVAMIYDGVWSSVRYREAKFDWDVAPFPNGKVPVSMGWYSPLSITSKASHKEEAWKWISFCTSAEGQKIVSSLGEAVPPLKSLAESKAFLNPNTKPKHKQVFLDQMAPDLLRTVGDKVGSYFGGYAVEWGDAFSPIWDAVLTGKKEAGPAMKAARPKLEAVLQGHKPS